MYEIDLLIITVMTLALAGLIAFLTLSIISYSSHASVSALATALASVCLANSSSMIVHISLSGKIVCTRNLLCTTDNLLVMYLRNIANASFVRIGNLFCVNKLGDYRLVVYCNFTKIVGPVSLLVESTDVEPWSKLCVVHVDLVK